MSFRRSKRSALLAIAVACASPIPGLGATGQWIVNGGGNWNLSGNWNGGIIPNATDDVADFASLDLTADATVTLDVPVTLGQLTFGDTDTLTAAGWVLSGTNALTLSTTGPAPTVTVNALGTGEVAAISAPIAGTQGLTKAGVGTLVLSGANTYSGGTTISGGTLQVGAGGTVGVLGTGAIVDNGALVVNRSDAITIADNISGSGTLQKLGAGVLTIGGTNTYGGTTAIDGGSIIFSAPTGYSGLAANSISVNAGGAIQNGLATVNDGTFLGAINTASTGAFALTAIDAATNFDFTTGTFAPYSGMSVGVTSGNTVSYTGTVTPAGGNYRLGGGGGTLVYNNVLSGANNLVAGAGGGGTVILPSNNTYTGTTDVQTGTTLVVGNAGTTGSLGTGAVTATGTGNVVFNRTDSFTVANNFTGGGLRKSGAGTVTVSGTISVVDVNVFRGTAAGSTLLVNGGSVTASGLSTIGGTGTGSGTNGPVFILQSGSATFNGGIRSDSNDASIIRVDGGTFSATDVNIRRNSAGTPSFTSGFIVTGGTATVGTIGLGTANSNGAMSVTGGSLTATGPITVGFQTSGGRGGAISISGGTFSATDTATGIIMSRKNGTNNNVSSATFSGGISTVGKFTMGFDATADGGSGTITLSGTGQLYIGSGGIVRNATGTYTSNLNITSTTALLGAAADHSSSGITTNLNVASTIKAADASDVPRNMTWSGAVAGAGQLIKTGGGMLDLQGTNSWTGGAAVNAGTLAGKASSLRGNIVNNATVAFSDQTGSTTTFTGVISGGGNVTKIGSGTSVVNSGQTYTGSTTVNAGLFGIGGSFTNSSGFTVNNGGGLLVRSGGATVNSLTLGSVGTDAMTLSHNDGSGLATLNVANTNGLATSGTTTIDVGASNITVGTTVLVNYAGSIGGAGYGGFTLGSLPPRMIASLVNNVGNTSVDLNVTGFDLPRWNGNVSDDWDINTTSNWRTVNTNAVTTYLQSSVPGDQVLFNDLAVGNTSVDITTTVQPSSVTVNNSSLSYTFAGTGKISGSTGLVKQGTNSLTVSNTGGNDYTGGTTIAGGTLQLGNATALPAGGHITITGGTFDINNQNPTYSGNLSLQGGSIANGTITKNSGSYDLQSGTVDASATLSGSAGATKTGAGTVILAGSTHNYAGLTTVSAGTLQLGDGANTGSTPGAILNTGTVAFNNGGEQIWTFGITGMSGTVVKDGAVPLYMTGVNEGNAIVNGVVVLVGPGGASVVPRLGRGGVLTVNSGGTVLCQGGQALGLNTANLPPSFVLNPGGTITADAGADLSIYNGTFAGGILTGVSGYISFGLRGDYTVADNTTSLLNAPGDVSLNNAVIFTTAGANAVIDISSNLIGATSLEITGPGKAILSGANTFNTGMSVTGGATVEFTTPANLGDVAGAVTLNTGTLKTLGPVTIAHQLRTTGGGTIDTNGFDSTVSGAITQNGPITKTGAGMLTFDGANTYTGTTTVNAGTLRTTGVGTLGAAGGAVVNNATLQLYSPNSLGAVGGTGTTDIGDGATGVAVSATHFRQGTLNVNTNSTATVAAQADPTNPSSAAGVSQLNALVLGTGSKIDITNNKLITQNALGTWDGSQYTGMTGLVQSGRGDGTWNGNGIVTSQTDATTSVLTGLAISSGAENFGLGPTDTMVWAGQTINGDSTLVMYTWGGDADLNGELNGDDYFFIDSNAPANGSVFGYHQGDFDYNGTIDGDDYFIIDSNITFAQASTPFWFAAGGGGSGSGGLSAVPEPASIGALGLAAASLLGRRRRRAQ